MGIRWAGACKLFKAVPSTVSIQERSAVVVVDVIISGIIIPIIYMPPGCFLQSYWIFVLPMPSGLQLLGVGCGINGFQEGITGKALPSCSPATGKVCSVCVDCGV